MIPLIVAAALQIPAIAGAQDVAVSTYAPPAYLLKLPHSTPPKDFDRFWKNTRRELAEIPLDPWLEPAPEASDAKTDCFKASYLSWKGKRVHAWYCRPKSGGPFPAVLISPWYGEGRIDAPKYPASDGFAVLWYQARGYEVDQDSYPKDNEDYVLSGIEHRDSYVYREIVSHGLRGIDFLAGRPEVDKARIGAGGASQGGGLSLILAALDPRIAVVSADFPFLCDFQTSLAAPEHPFRAIRERLELRPDRKASVLRALAYYDVLNFAGRIKVPALVLAGLKDETCPAQGILRVFRGIPEGKKELGIFPSAAHNTHNTARWNRMLDFLLRHLL